mmetsp:Transcript_2784/g.3859  ORF Transcript_2784/g.3859 Transcript_2784/m.3859 type:complete len:615 (+) Transcript_2784:2-1846(+)
MNPNAKEFVFSPSAEVWKPRAALTPPIPPILQQQTTTSLPSPPVPETNGTEDADDEEIDENDPLWKATLALTLGNRKEALKLLEDPDSLMQYPEIKKIMESGNDSNEVGDSWENMEALSSQLSAVAISAEVTPIDSINQLKDDSANSPKAPASSNFVTAEEDGEALAEQSEVVEGDPREHLNIVFIGHVDAGKSTLSGSILYLMGQVDARTIERFEREAKQRNRESWFLAFILDTSEEERAKGKTVEVGRAHFETEKTRYTILDAPGHKNYVPNMIAGATQADVGVLVISARKGEFETGFEKGGQTREHALLARTLGVQHLVVVINKMDDPTVEWEQARFEECVGKLKPYLKQVGYVIKKDVKFVPISGLNGCNVLNEVKPEKCSWWRGLYTSGAHNTFTPTLLATLDSLVISDRHPDGPLRIPVLDRYFERGCVVLGKVESGTVRVGDELVVAPTRKKAKVEEIVIGDNKVRSAKPGENVLLKFALNVEDVQKGYVLCTSGSLCTAVTEIKVQLALVDMLEHRPIFSPGYDCVMHTHTVEIEVHCAELIGVIDKGKPMRRPFARTGQVCIARLVMPLHTCMETFERMPSMGRLTLRDEGKTIAIGKILEILQK